MSGTKYDTEIQTVTRTSNVDTRHTDYVDWDYDFHDPKHTETMCCSDERKREDVEERIEWLREVERCLRDDVPVWASTYGGWPRIWHRVLGIGMWSAWPYWRPRPTVEMSGTLGMEVHDWRHLTGVEARPEARK